MALKSGRVGVRPDQVDHYGRLIPTDYLIDILRDMLSVEEAEAKALQMARQKYLEEKEKPVIEPIEFPQGNEEKEP